MFAHTCLPSTQVERGSLLNVTAPLAVPSAPALAPLAAEQAAPAPGSFHGAHAFGPSLHACTPQLPRPSAAPAAALGLWLSGSASSRPAPTRQPGAVQPAAAEAAPGASLPLARALLTGAAKAVAGEGAPSTAAAGSRSAGQPPGSAIVRSVAQVPSPNMPRLASMRPRAAPLRSAMPPLAPAVGTVQPAAELPAAPESMKGGAAQAPPHRPGQDPRQPAAVAAPGLASNSARMAVGPAQATSAEELPGPGQGSGLQELRAAPSAPAAAPEARFRGMPTALPGEVPSSWPVLFL